MNIEGFRYMQQVCLEMMQAGMAAKSQTITYSEIIAHNKNKYSPQFFNPEFPSWQIEIAPGRSYESRPTNRGDHFFPSVPT
ncbi:hypothetical protein BofuT4_P078230.1 [Botrytis cinerea T4]|uniref:Uncharacterized protein n=1 Tax=Botryotinia fuckeliana (strain T4) TaxID=999810 RepID=G2YLN2_BOTF4|nr:hypothetical protein BofuT4_P078230.1 [Botrytis cinerea T4]